MLDALLPSLVLVLLGFVVFTGAVFIVRGGFIRMAVGALIVALCISIILSSCAVVLLEASSSLPSDAIIVVFLRGTLAAIAQPTVAGVTLLAILVVLALSASRVCGLVEDIQILLDAHKTVAAGSKSKSS